MESFILIVSIIFSVICITSSEVGIMKTHEAKNHKSVESKLRDIKHITEELLASNNTDKLPSTILYEKWSKWSKCRNCKKTRKRKCISNICKFTTQVEQRLCSKLKCRMGRKSRRKIRFNIMEKEGRQNPDLKYLNDWGPWSLCQRNCTTKRYKYCTDPRYCVTRREVQTAYCFVEGSRCERLAPNYARRSYAFDAITMSKRYSEYNSWLNFLIHNRFNKYNRYDHTSTTTTTTTTSTTTTTTTTMKPVYKKKKKKNKKCGVVFPNATYSISYNMLRIIGGMETYKSKWPWHVALMNRFKEVFCGGTLISPKWVLTAAHCLRTILYASINEYDISYEDGTEIQFRISRMYVHPRFNPITIDNDIALLKLPRAVSLPHACLPYTEPMVGEKCTIMGWGKRKMNDFRGSKRLREAQLPIVSKDTCLKSYRRYVITENMFCAGYRNGGTDTCSGDSGGGLFCPPRKKRGWTVQGITSFGEGCGKRGKYGIYVTVNNYLNWIRYIMTKK